MGRPGVAVILTLTIGLTISCLAQEALAPGVASQRDLVSRDLDACQKALDQAAKGSPVPAAETACQKAVRDSQGLPDRPELFFWRTKPQDNLAQVYVIEKRYSDAAAIYRTLVHLPLSPGGDGYMAYLNEALGITEALDGDLLNARADLATSQRGWETEIKNDDRTGPNPAALRAKLSNLQSERVVVTAEVRVAQALGDAKGMAADQKVLVELASTIKTTDRAVQAMGPEHVYDPSAPVREGKIILTTDRKCLRCPLPEYPAMLRSLQMEGTTVLRATLAQNGTVKDVAVVSGATIFGLLIARSAKNWQFEPPPADVRVPVVTITAQFKLNKK